jgi:hypothetical protein
MKPKEKLIPLTEINYLEFARATAGSKMFRHLYFGQGKKRVDILDNGRLSCAFFISGVLTMFGLIGAVHTTVDGTIRDLVGSGWKKIKRPKTGSVIFWAPRKYRNGETHGHIGFYLGGGKAISNSSEKKAPAVHAWDFRPVEAIFWHNRASKLK